MCKWIRRKGFEEGFGVIGLGSVGVGLWGDEVDWCGIGVV